MKIINYINKYKVHIALFIAIVLIILVIMNYSMNYNKIIEGLVACGDATTCSTCVTATLNSANVPCYWNTVNQTCGTFDDPNDVRTCPSCTTFTDCSSCIKNGCYWDPSLNMCGRDLSGNYRAECSNTYNCEKYTDCSSCTTNKPCFWTNDTTAATKCASFISPGYTSTCGEPSLCTSFTDCSSCINNGCYWDASLNKCGSPFSKGNYKPTCPSSSPSCSSFSFTDCSSCIQGNSSCYWNSSSKTCKLNSGSGYSRVCNSNSCPNYVKLPFDTYMQTT